MVLVSKARRVCQEPGSACTQYISHSLWRVARTTVATWPSASFSASSCNGPARLATKVQYQWQTSFNLNRNVALLSNYVHILNLIKWRFARDALTTCDDIPSAAQYIRPPLPVITYPFLHPDFKFLTRSNAQNCSLRGKDLTYKKHILTVSKWNRNVIVNLKGLLY
jgi:hypothetical protein